MNNEEISTYDMDMEEVIKLLKKLRNQYINNHDNWETRQDTITNYLDVYRLMGLLQGADCSHEGHILKTTLSNIEFLIRDMVAVARNNHVL